MRVLIDGKRASLDLRRVLGEGGEAAVLAHKSGGIALAVKLYKTPPGPAHSAKLAALRALGQRLGPHVLAPLGLVTDEKSGVLLGFTMSALDPGFEPVALLAKAQARAALGLDLAATFELLVELGDGVARLHQAGVVIGDFNDQNELFHPAVRAGAARVVFIDVDSFQLGPHACQVATEAYLDPALYGPDLAAPCATLGGAPRVFSPASDWWSYAVLAFRALTGAHPFGGVCASPDLGSVPRRAAARLSALSPAVKLPREARLRVEALPGDLLAAFARTFEGGARDPLPRPLLVAAATGARSCSCGLALAGGVVRCPRCTVVARSGPAGGLDVRELARARGEIVAMSLRGDAFVALVREGDALRLLRGEVTGSSPEERPLTLPFELAGASLSLADDLVLVSAPDGAHARVAYLRAGDGQLYGTAASELALGRAAACALGRPSRVLRVLRGALIELDVATGEERQVGAVVAEQTRLEPTAEGVVTSTQVLGKRMLATIKGRVTTELAPLPLEPHEVVLADAFYAAGGLTAGLFHTRLYGRDRVRRALWDARGERLADGVVAADLRAAGLALRGGVLRGSALLIAGDRGLCREDLSNGAATLFPETEPFVRAEAPLAACARGVVAAAFGALRLLTLQARAT